LAFNELRQTRDEKKSKSPSNHEISVSTYSHQIAPNRTKKIVLMAKKSQFGPFWLNAPSCASPSASNQGMTCAESR
jgi:hypothetical protein